jgi:Cu(I)/Ag(I) efflux system membrane fusion protein
MTPEAAQLANVLTSVVSKQTLVKEVRLYGKIQADERLLQNQVAHIPGRIESLTVNFTGESIVIGQTLGKIYSPELITAQQELLEAFKTKNQPNLGLPKKDCDSGNLLINRLKKLKSREKYRTLLILYLIQMEL